MALKTYRCPNCGANYNPASQQCEYCGSYIFASKENYTDFSNINIVLPEKPLRDDGKYPGIYVFGRLLGKGERPITLGAANYYTGLFSAGGKLLLTNMSLSFSAHQFNVGRQETRIDLKDITDVTIGSDMLISQQLLVTANGKRHKFVVYHGADWVKKIQNAQAALTAPVAVPVAAPAQVQQAAPAANAAYIAELQQLKQLMDSGVISEAEFNAKKRQLLGF